MVCSEGLSSPAAPWYHDLRHMRLSGLQWGGTDAPPVLALHGWLDNAASFSRLGPRLADEYRLIALDLPGHGASDHRSPDADYPLLAYVVDVAETLAGFDRPVILMGHSLGGIIASLVSTVVPERVAKLVLIDALGPPTAPAGHFVKRLRKAVQHRLRPQRAAARVFASVEAAMATRMDGAMALTAEAARPIVGRNLRQAGSGWTWRTDPKLRDPSLAFLSEEQVLAYLRQIQAPTLLVAARQGLVARYPDLEARKGAVANLVEIQVPGGHHCHLETESEAAVAGGIRSFLE